MSRPNQRRIGEETRRLRRRHAWRLIRPVLTAGGVLVSLGATLWGLNGALSVSHWQIDGNTDLKARIEQQLQQMNHRDYLHTRPARLREQWLAAIPDLADVRISRRLPDALQVTAVARTPVALWQDEAGHIHLVDGKGHAYRPIAAGESPDLPMLRIRKNQLSQARLLLEALAAQRIRDLQALSEIRSSNQAWLVYFSRGERWMIPHRREARVLQKLADLLSRPRWRSRVWRVDARMTSRWFLRPAKHEGVI